jgi:thiol-disulfide isomerase/thioredoxin
MRVPAAILIAACTLAAGCTALTGRSRDRDRDRDRDRAPVDRTDREWWLDGSESGGRGRVRPIPDEVARTNRESVIAGTVVDAHDGKPLKGTTFIRVRPADEVAPVSSHGVGFETDADGYFLCAMLKPGQTYILSVVREVDGRKVAGEMQVKPPQSNLRLELSEDKVSSVTPPLPPPPGLGPFDPRGSDTRAPADPPLPGPPPLDSPGPALRRENIAGTPTMPPTAAIRPPPAAAPNSPPPVRPTETDPPSARLPGGQRVPNFVVSNVLGEDWDLHSASGRLILVEFWSTTCVPCARAVPAIKRLQADYGRSGLEIVAVACEADASFNARATAVDAVARRKEMTYRVYLEREGRVGEIQCLFNVQWVPTLVLLDRQGTVLWRGGASEPDLARVDEILRTNLSRR